ncbi:DNA-directed RNA polymerase II subunit 7 [Gregarina niphandrodes]|uniref:DNA-directed RNA polymerase II subunit 7 n=1 Tax=Gregarina niphandrodes TaxID=110365 RepID=A0A023BBH6_GRENI|nr:DNA-directed RNA polymerase II subunit 7 [Gregarina niphandrodes]EZG79386.1 DNA-directed RNA polymerase II subunit 7 [Gregarina niphandrodes]|eukprot:XP_011129056.1 DNA-directed RNA polymerase II subunit 7 [Gregarina niphandrodes]
MFFIVDLHRNVCIKPGQLGPNFEQHVADTLRSDIEGRCISKYGYIVCVVRLLEREKGRVQDGSGNIIVPVKCQAVAFQPVKEEVMDGVIVSVNSMGFFAQCGPIKAFVTASNLSGDYKQHNGVWTDGSTRLGVDQDVRIRILGYKYETNGMTAVAQMDQDFLGPP